MSRGYFPRELPPGLTTERLGAVASALTISKKRSKEWSTPARFSIGRPGGLRRQLSLTNPISQLAVASVVVEEWDKLSRHLERSTFSLSRPVATGHPNSRALAPSRRFFDRPYERLRRRRLAAYTLHADIAQFYPTIYTHSIPWALNGREAAKAALRSGTISSLLGDRLDEAMRTANDGQTVGIPIGPDTSLVVSEILLSSVDDALATRKDLEIVNGLRYVDDIELYFRSRAQAEDALVALEAELLRYELALNASKTSVTEMPLNIESSWRSVLHTTPVSSSTDRRAANDLAALFNLALEARRGNPNDPVVSYALQKARGLIRGPLSSAVVQDVALSSLNYEPSAFPYVCEVLIDAMAQGYKWDQQSVEGVINATLMKHAPLEHSYEVTWGLWALGALGLQLTADAARSIASMRDNASLLLYLWLNDLRQVDSFSAPDRLDLIEGSEDAHVTEDWLLAYESVVQGWASVPGVRKDVAFRRLLEAKVTFLRGFAIPRPQIRRAVDTGGGMDMSDTGASVCPRASDADESDASAGPGVVLPIAGLHVY